MNVSLSFSIGTFCINYLNLNNSIRNCTL
jgi:hypothetical protein